MRAATIILREFQDLPGVHQSRLKCVAKVTAAVLVSSRLALTLLGRAMSGHAKARHAIKCVDRLLGNVAFHVEIGLFYARLAERVLPRRGRPVLLIDWTDIGTLWTALVVTLVAEGRGIVLCSEVHPRRKVNDPRVESSILKKLDELLPDCCKPILVSDAGFRGPWLKKVAAKGWDFVGRVRGRLFVQRSGSEKWLPVKCLWNKATARPQDLGRYSLARYLPVEARIVAVKKSTKSLKALPKVGRRKQKGIRAAMEPWILATSMTQASPREVVRLYALRMRIELTFRDQKCPRFGLALDQIRTENIDRVRGYLLLATLAHYVAMFIGQAAERAGLHRDYQANTRVRRVLSWARLGREIIQRSMREALTCVPKLPPRLFLEVTTNSS